MTVSYKEKSDQMEKTWICPKDGNVNDGMFCTTCGMPRRDAEQWGSAPAAPVYPGQEQMPWMQPPVKKRKPWWIAVVAAVLAVAVLAAALLIPMLAAGRSGGSDRRVSDRKDRDEDEAQTEAVTEKERDIRDIHIGMVVPTLDSEYWTMVKDGCDTATAEIGISLTILVPDGEWDIEGQVAMIDELIGGDFDAIICAPSDVGAAADALQKAVDAGIPVISLETDMELEGQTCFVGPSNASATWQGVIWAAEELDGTGNAAVIYAMDGDAFSGMIRSFYESACAQYGLTVLESVSSQNSTGGAAAAMEQLLVDHYGQLDVVFCQNDAIAMGAAEACMAAGVEDVLIVSLGGTRMFTDLLTDGYIRGATVAFQPYSMGFLAVELACRAAMGEPVEPVVIAPVMVVDLQTIPDHKYVMGWE